MHSQVGSKIFDSICECIGSFVLIFIRKLSQSTIDWYLTLNVEQSRHQPSNNDINLRTSPSKTSLLHVDVGE